MLQSPADNRCGAKKTMLQERDEDDRHKYTRRSININGEGARRRGGRGLRMLVGSNRGLKKEELWPMRKRAAICLTHPR
jgi:hypothetical protein